MKQKTMNKIIKSNLQAQFDGKDILIPCIYGSRGIGKTSSIKKIAKELNAALINISVPSKDLVFFTGLPEFTTQDDMTKYSVSNAQNVKGTAWTTPELIVQANRLAESEGRCIILLDDFHKLSGGIQEAMYEFLLERKLGDYKLNSNVAIVCAMNFSKESGADVMEEPIKDRLALLKAEFDFEYWYNHFGKFTHHYISSFLKANQHLVLEDETITLQSNGSPRSWTLFSNELELYDNDFIQEHAIELAQQYVTPNTAKELAKHIAYMEAIDFTNVIQSRNLKDVSELPIIDRIIWGYIVNYIETPEDAAYIINLIDKNEDEETFIGYIASEIFTKYLAKEAGKPITLATEILIDKLLGQFNPKTYKLTPKQTELLEDTNFNDASKLLSIASSYLS